MTANAIGIEPVMGCGPTATGPVVDARARTAALLIAAACGLGGLYALGALLPFWYLSEPASGVAFFPSAGLTLAFLALTPRRTWPLWLATVAAAEMTVDLTHDQTVPMALGFAAANTLEPLVGAIALTRLVPRSPRVRRNLVGYVLAAVVIGPLVGGVIGATTAVVFGDASGWAAVAGRWWLGDALGVLVIATPILAFARRSPFEAQASQLETAAMVVIATGITLVPAVLWHHPMIYAVIPVLMWAAFRGGTRAVTLAGAGVALAGNWAVVTGRLSDLIAHADEAEHLVFVQIFLAITLLTGLTLAAEVADRRRLEHEARRSEARRVVSERRASEIAERERQRIAQETHDIVGHGLTVMLLQAGAARQVLDNDAALARQLLDSIEVVGRNACNDLDIALASSERSADLAPGRGLGSVAGLVEVLRAAGMQVDLDVKGTNSAVSRLVDRSAFSIVQEALTNIAKHAPDARAKVTITFEADEVLVSVVDDGAGTSPPAHHSEGRGLIGMRERAAALGGELEVGSAGEQGFSVTARLPWRAAPA